MDSIFRANMYAMFGFLAITMIMQFIVISLLSIISCYMSLCNQDYDWWWRSFIIGASGSCYIALYAIYYIAINFRLTEWASDAAFIIYLYIFMGCYGCMTGTVGVMASYNFISRIYKDIRTD